MKMFTKKSLNALSQKIDIKKVATCIGIDIDECDDRINIYKCPFCNNNFFVLFDNNTYYCGDCKAQGDTISLFMLMRKKTFVETINFLSIMFDVDMEEITNDEQTTKNNKNNLQLIELIKNKVKEMSLDDETLMLFMKIYDKLKKEV